MNMADITTTTLILVFCLVSGLHTWRIPNDDICGIISNTTVNGYDECPYPWMVTIHMTPYLCSGSIIDSRHVLTAATCFNVNVSRVNRTPIDTRGRGFVILRYRKTLNIEKYERIVDVSQITVLKDPDHEGLRGLDDLAILTLASPIEFNKCQRPICLSHDGISLGVAKDCKLMLAADNVHHQHTSVQLINDAACSNLNTYYRKNTTFCTTRDPGICMSHRGGAYACLRSDGRYYLHGVVLRDSEYYCYSDRNVYMNVSVFMPWILSNRVPNDDLCGTLDVTHGDKTSSDCPYPWMAHVCSFQKTCSGIIIDSKHVLTTAFCFTDNPENLKDIPYPGSTFVIPGLRRENLNQADCTAYPDSIRVAYVDFYQDNLRRKLDDYPVLLTVDRPIKFDRCHRPICLTDNSKSVEDAKKCMVTKAGEVYNSQHGEFTFESHETCSFLYHLYNNETMFCSEHYRKICPAQRGSAFVCQKNDGKYYLYGIMPDISEYICKYYYAVYTKIPHYIPWINKNRMPNIVPCGIGDYNDCPWPWMINICTEKGVFSGVIIDLRHILTARTPFMKFENDTGPFSVSSVFVLPGTSWNQYIQFSNCSSQPDVMTVTQIISHEKTEPFFAADDLVILKLASLIKLDRCHRPICMQQTVKESHIPYEHTRGCLIMKTSHDYDKQISTIEWYRALYCKYELLKLYKGDKIQCIQEEGEVCPTPNYGAALVCQETNGKYYLYGLSTQLSLNQCNDKYFIEYRARPYTMVNYYLPWINKNSV